MSIFSLARGCLHESYNRELSYLAEYLRERPLPLLDHWWHFINWRRAGEIAKRAGISTNLVALDPTESDDDLEATYAMEAVMTDEEKFKLASIVMGSDPADAPSWEHMSFDRILRPSTWLVHKGDDNDIWRNGFRHGEPDYARLGLTTWKKDRLRGPGYNFAFQSGRVDPEKYGSNAYMFQAAAVLVHHYGDDEYQAVFWGPSVDPRNIVLIERDIYAEESREWVVVAKSNDGSGRALHGFEEIESAVNWVQDNLSQYRRPLGIGK